MLDSLRIPQFLSQLLGRSTTEVPSKPQSVTKTAVCDKNWGREIAHEAAPRTLNGREAPFTYPIMDVGGAAFADAFSWCEVCNKHLAVGTCDAGWCAKCYTSAAQGGTMLTLAVHDTTGCECGGRGAQLGSLLPLTGATSSAATLPGAYAQALDAAALPQATRVAFGPCQYLVFAGLSTDGRRHRSRRYSTTCIRYSRYHRQHDGRLVLDEIGRDTTRCH